MHWNVWKDIHPQMLSGGISGYFYIKCMGFYNKHVVVTSENNPTIIYWASALLGTMPGCYYSEIQKSKSFSHMRGLKHFCDLRPVPIFKSHFFYLHVLVWGIHSLLLPMFTVTKLLISVVSPQKNWVTQYQDHGELNPAPRLQERRVRAHWPAPSRCRQAQSQCSSLFLITLLGFLKMTFL